MYFSLFRALDHALADNVAVFELVDVLAPGVHAVNGCLDSALFLVCGMDAVAFHMITCVQYSKKSKAWISRTPRCLFIYFLVFYRSMSNH